MSVNFVQHIKYLHYLSQLFGISFFSLREYETEHLSETIINFIIILPAIFSYFYCCWLTILDIRNVITFNAHVSSSYITVLLMMNVLDFVLTCVYNFIYRHKLKSAILLINQHVHINYSKKCYILNLKIALPVCVFCAMLINELIRFKTMSTHNRLVIKFGIFFNCFTTCKHMIDQYN